MFFRKCAGLFSFAGCCLKTDRLMTGREVRWGVFGQEIVVSER